MQREAPHSLEAERSVLGGILLDNESLHSVVELITAEDFYHPAHRELYATMLALSERNQPIDAVTLTDALRDRDVLDKVGGPLAVAQLSEGVPTAANLNFYARIVRDKALARRMASVGAEIAKEGLAGIEDVSEYVDSAERRVMEVNADRMGAGLVPMRQVVKDTFKHIEKLYEQKETITGLPTDFRDLDRMTAGFQSGDLIILAARPSMGKTSFAMNVCANAATGHNKPVAFFSLEMSSESLAMRMLSVEARVDATRMRTGHLTNSDWDKMTRAAGKLAEAPLYIDDSGTLSVLELRSKCRRLKMRSGLSFICVDYLQLMHGGKGGGESREREISDISRGLKSLAKELEVPVMALSQLNRTLENREEKRPKLSDLRESGAIEQDADLVMFVYRDEVYNKETQDKNIAEIIIGKHRNGPIGSVRMLFQNHLTRFDNLEEDHEQMGAA